MTWAGLTTLGASAEEAQQVMEELDVGKTGRISYTEFLAGAREHSGGMAEQLVLGGVFAMFFFWGGMHSAHQCTLIVCLFLFFGESQLAW